MQAIGGNACYALIGQYCVLHGNVYIILQFASFRIYLFSGLSDPAFPALNAIPSIDTGRFSISSVSYVKPVAGVQIIGTGRVG